LKEEKPDKIFLTLSWLAEVLGRWIIRKDDGTIAITMVYGILTPPIALDSMDTFVYG